MKTDKNQEQTKQNIQRKTQKIILKLLRALNSHVFFLIEIEK